MKFKTTILFVLLIVANSYAQQTPSLTIQFSRPIDAELIIFNGLSSRSLAILQSNTPQFVNIKTNYKGLAILRYRSGHIYPIYFNGKSFSMELGDPNTAPVFLNNEENDYLYQWLGDYLLLNRDQQFLQTIVEKLGANDPFASELYIEQKNIEEKRSSVLEMLEKEPNIGVTLLIKSRMLNESSYAVKSKEELETMKIVYQQFVKNNLDELYHSDMLPSLCRQDLMMNEYVLISKDDFYSQVNKDVKRWIAILSPRIEPEKTIAFMMEVFYNRGMVSVAESILQSNREYLNRRVFRLSDNIIPFFTIKEEVENIPLKTSEGIDRGNLYDFKGYKILSMVGDDDIVSQVSTVVIARDLERLQLLIPTIVVPEETLTNKHYAMDKLFTGTMFFMHGNSTGVDFNKNYFQFYLIDENNIVQMASNNKNELLVTLKK